MKNLFLLVALLAGALIPVQTIFNGLLGRSLGNTVQATTASFLVATLAMLLGAAATQTALPTGAQLGAVSPLAWLGGAIGAVYITGVVFVAPRIGIATVTVLVVVGQVLSAMLIEHFGWLGAPQQPLSLHRLAGVALLVLGVLAIRKV